MDAASVSGDSSFRSATLSPVGSHRGSQVRGGAKKRSVVEGGAVLRAPLTPAEEAVERAVVSGHKVLFSGMALPPEVAKRLQKTETVATKDTFLVTCFVDLFLAPPSPLCATHSAGRGSPVRISSGGAFRGGQQRATFVGDTYEQLTFSQMSSSTPLHATVAASARPLLEPLAEQLKHEPRGPYIVRVPVSATVSAAAALIQDRLRSIQHQERREMHQNALSLKQPHMLYGHSLVAAEDVAQVRESALAKAAQLQDKRQRAQGDMQSTDRPSPTVGGRRQSFAGPSARRHSRRLSATPEVLSIQTTPGAKPLEGFHFGGPVAVSLANSLVPLVKTVSADDVLGPHHVGLKSLASLPVDIPPVGGSLSMKLLNDTFHREPHRSGAVSSPVESMSPTNMSMTSFHAFDAAAGEEASLTECVSLPLGDRRPPSGKHAQLRSPHSTPSPSGSHSPTTADYSTVFSDRQLTIRPCDASGKVFQHTNPHAEGRLAAGEFDDSRTLMSQFPKGTINFYVCLAPSPAYHRHLIAAAHRDCIQHQERERLSLEEHRLMRLSEKAAKQREVDTAKLTNSISRDELLRSQLSRPTATESFKEFMKAEAKEEYDKRKAAAQAARQQECLERKAAACAEAKQHMIRVMLLSKLEAEAFAALRDDEALQWLSLMQLEVSSRADRNKKLRVSQALRDVAQSMDTLMSTWLNGAADTSHCLLQA